MNVKDLSIEVKGLILGVAFTSFLVSPLFWGSITLMAMGVFWKPWPAVIALSTMALVAFSWIILWNRVKSDWLVGINIFFGVVIAGAVIGTNDLLTDATRMTWAFIIYALSALLVFLNGNLALFAAIGINITKAEEVDKDVHNVSA